MALYIRYCLNHKCGKVFKTDKHNQVYCSSSCRRANTKEKRNTTRKSKLVWKKCNWCGEYDLKNSNEDGFCNERHRTNYKQYVEQKKICPRCIHWSLQDEMCCFTLHTGYMRDIYHHPCRNFESRRVKK